MRKLVTIAGVIMALMLCADASALTLEKIKYGDFSQWVTRHITESKVIGGKTKTIYAIGPTRTISGNTPYTPTGGSPWATSNVYAKVSGVSKASNTVEPVVVNGNKMCKLYTKIEEVKVLGLLNMDVMVPGTIYLGKVREPISSTKNPYAKMEMGMPYTKRPKALVFDYKVDMPNTNTRQGHRLWQQEDSPGARQRRSLCPAPEAMGGCQRQHPRPARRHRPRAIRQKCAPDQGPPAAYPLRQHHEKVVLQVVYGAPQRRQGLLRI